MSLSSDWLYVVPWEGSNELPSLPQYEHLGDVGIQGCQHDRNSEAMGSHEGSSQLMAYKQGLQDWDKHSPASFNLNIMEPSMIQHLQLAGASDIYDISDIIKIQQCQCRALLEESFQPRTSSCPSQYAPSSYEALHYSPALHHPFPSSAVLPYQSLEESPGLSGHYRPYAVSSNDMRSACWIQNDVIHVGETGSPYISDSQSTSTDDGGSSPQYAIRVIRSVRQVCDALGCTRTYRHIEHLRRHQRM
jgi:hypothetical protein